jgi:hypothetical protein
MTFPYPSTCQLGCNGGSSQLLRNAAWLCAVLTLQLCTGFATAQQNTPQRSPTIQPISAQHSSPNHDGGPEVSPHDALKTESAVFKDREKEREYVILLWTLIITALGVAAGLFALFFAWLAVSEAQRQARENAKMSKAQFWILLRGIFTSYDDIHANFRPDGDWHSDSELPSATADKGRTELYMGLFEYCDRLLEEGLIDKQAFAASYSYRLRNILTNPWVIEKKLKAHRRGWRGFINLCYRILNEPIPDVPKLTAAEHSELYPKGG